MLSVEECRRILGVPQLSDEEVVEIRDTLVAFVQVFIDDYLRKIKAAKPSPDEQ